MLIAANTGMRAANMFRSDNDRGAAIIDDPIETTERTFTASNRSIINPERGFHKFGLLRSPQDLRYIRAAGITLVQSNVLIADTRDVDTIPSAALVEIQRGFDLARDAGIKVMPRFVYDDTAAGRDAPIERVIGHIGQLESILRKNSDVIAFMPAGFIGAWGEWHTSANGLTEPAKANRIIDALLDALPVERSIQLRTPAHKVARFGAGPLDPALAFTSAPIARVGHHNDGFLSSDTDWGTYPTGERERWVAWLSEETQFVPFGGETCSVHARNACAAALDEMARLHTTHVNLDYNGDVIQRWRSEGCFDEIERRLGYRLVLLKAALPDEAAAGDRFRLQVSLKNDGWASPLNARPVVLTFEKGGRSYDVRLDGVDWRRWSAGATSKIDTMVTIPDDLTPGTWRVLLRLPDAGVSTQNRSDYAVQTANECTWDEALGGNVLGTVAVVP